MNAEKDDFGAAALEGQASRGEANHGKSKGKDPRL